MHPVPHAASSAPTAPIAPEKPRPEQTAFAALFTELSRLSGADAAAMDGRARRSPDSEPGDDSCGAKGEEGRLTTSEETGQVPGPASGGPEGSPTDAQSDTAPICMIDAFTQGRETDLGKAATLPAADAPVATLAVAPGGAAVGRDGIGHSAGRVATAMQAPVVPAAGPRPVAHPLAELRFAAQGLGADRTATDLVLQTPSVRVASAPQVDLVPGLTSALAPVGPSLAPGQQAQLAAPMMPGQMGLNRAENTVPAASTHPPPQTLTNAPAAGAPGNPAELPSPARIHVVQSQAGVSVAPQINTTVAAFKDTIAPPAQSEPTVSAQRGPLQQGLGYGPSGNPPTTGPFAAAPRSESMVPTAEIGRAGPAPSVRQETPGDIAPPAPAPASPSSEGLTHGPPPPAETGREATSDSLIAVAPSTETRAGAHGPVAPPGPAKPTDPARSVAMQVAAHLPEQGRGFELSLQPEELGRVRINLTASETGGTLLIQAERPETLDLMRRHAMQLAQELRALGHEALSLEFSHFGGSPQHGNPGGDATRPVLGHGTVPGTDVASDQGVINTLTLHAAPDHLDIRL